MRDSETAQNAVQVALTGPVFSTLHTNDALPRAHGGLGIEPFMNSWTIVGAMAQRLTTTISTTAIGPAPEYGRGFQ